MATQKRVSEAELQDIERQLITSYGEPSVENTDFMSRALVRVIAEVRAMKRERADERIAA